MTAQVMLAMQRCSSDYKKVVHTLANAHETRGDALKYPNDRLCDAIYDCRETRANTTVDYLFMSQSQR
jgi:hypothetical protein